MNLGTDIRLIQEFEERYVVNGKVQRRFVDFAHPETKTAIELDGSVHKRLDVQANDFKRQREMEGIGWTFIRFSNPQILRNPQGCAQFALQCIHSRQHLQPVQHCYIPASFPRPAPRRRHHRRYRSYKRSLRQLFAAAVVIATLLFLILLTLK
jgi:very-short-patch-repair endonuclease